MGQVATISREFTAQHLKIIRANNPDLEAQEFDTFIEYARRAGLDPFRRQISAIVFGKKAKDKSRRRVAFVVGIDGYRAMADRTGTYMPHSEPPSFVQCEQTPTNPAGLLSCTVRVKKYAHGGWHEFSATAYWDEFAPVEEEWAEVEGRWQPSGKKKLADNWRKMPRVMLAKVAESQALRRGWPDTFAGSYTDDEIERERVLDLTASEVVEQQEVAERQARLGGAHAVMVSWSPEAPLERVPDGQFADRVLAWARDAKGLDIVQWQDRNRHSLQDFWARHKSEALDLREALAEILNAKAEAEAAVKAQAAE